MLQRCKDANLVLNWEKCHFVVKERIVLGHKIHNDETSDDSDVNDNFPGETLMEITTNDTPWYRYTRMELITLDLTCPSTYQLLRSSGGDSGPDLSFDKSASSKRLFSLARVSLAEASKPDLSFGWSGGDYTSSCPPSLVSAKLA
ncbi:hypothetical protein Tco_1148923 [Tanacetum coccineum]